MCNLEKQSDREMAFKEYMLNWLIYCSLTTEQQNNDGSSSDCKTLEHFHFISINTGILRFFTHHFYGLLVIILKHIHRHIHICLLHMVLIAYNISN